MRRKETRWLRPPAAALVCDVLVALGSMATGVPPSSPSLVVLNLAVTAHFIWPEEGDSREEARALPAVASAATMIAKVTGSKVKLMEFLSSCGVGRLEGAFRRSMDSLYAGESVEKAMKEATARLRSPGFGRSLSAIRGRGGLVTVGGQVELAALDLDLIYERALGSMESRLAVCQTVAFFAPLLLTFYLPQFVSGVAEASAALAVQSVLLRGLQETVGRFRLWTT